MNGFPSEEENPREITIQRKSLQRNETQRKWVQPENKEAKQQELLSDRKRNYSSLEETVGVEKESDALRSVFLSFCWTRSVS